jgi:hypothetical protein
VGTNFKRTGEKVRALSIPVEMGHSGRLHDASNASAQWVISDVALGSRNGQFDRLDD